ncbi:MAG: SDR family oxidoreductase [Microbacteriaceae bacterium]|nr:MAG: SDR family oxidoreductase [Microbacteriaceae bacterium]
MDILVTGGTGRLGRHVVPALRDRGHEVRVLSRRQGPGHVVGDLGTGAGIAPAVAGVDTVVHLASTSKNDDRQTRTLLDALDGSRTHLVYISIVGVDRVPLGLYRSKLAAEKAIAASGIPHTIIRVTQFHDFIVSMYLAPQRHLPVTCVLPGTVQPIDLRDVAARMVELVESGPSGRVADLAGPETRTLAEFAGEWQRSLGVRRPIWTLRLPIGFVRGVAAGGLTTGRPGDGRITFAEFLAAESAR